MDSEIDNPSTHKSTIIDLFDSNKKYEVLTYGTLIANNTFDSNFSGKRGTALLIELVNEIQVTNNRFMNNGPVETYSEMKHSPYYEHFLDKKRTLSFYLLETS